MTYTIISDKQKLIDFIDWLPALEADEKYYGCLFSRKKYTDHAVLSNDKTQLKRFLSTKERLLEKIEQLEVKLGAYKLKKIAAPQESLALYINPNPRNLRMATFNGIIELTKLLQANAKNLNPHAEMFSSIQKTIGRKIFLDFDIDNKAFDISKLEGIINASCLKILQTRGGYHLLVELSKVSPEYKNSFYKNISALGVDQVGDQLLPVPGCVQGGFMPKFISL